MLIKAKDTNKAKASEVVEVELFVVVVVVADVTLEEEEAVVVVFAEVAFEEVEAEVTFEEEVAADEEAEVTFEEEEEAADEEADVTLEAADEDAPVEAAEEERTLFEVQAALRLRPVEPIAVQTPTAFVSAATVLHPAPQAASLPQLKDCCAVELHVYFV